MDPADTCGCPHGRHVLCHIFRVSVVLKRRKCQ